MGWATGEINLVLYTDDGQIAGREPYWVQKALAMTVDMLSRVGMKKKLENTKAMVFTPGLICIQIGETVYKRRATGEGEIFRKMKRTRVSCSECGSTMADSSIWHHMEQSHGVIPPQTRGVDVGRGGSTTYVVSLPRILKLVKYQVLGFPEKVNITGRMREQFMYRNFRSKIVVLQ